MPEQPIIRVANLHRTFKVHDKEVRALAGVDLAIHPARTVAVVGESGSGKTTLGNLILGVDQPTAGHIFFRDQELVGKRLPEMRRRIQVVQQNPFSTLNPKRSIRQSIELPIRVNNLLPAAKRRDRVADLMTLVGLSPAYMDRYPKALSGGQRQRAALARALAADPEVIVLDEPTSALDVSVQAKVLAVLDELQRRFNLTYLFITHDLSVVRNFCIEVAVMYRGRIVEVGATEAVFRAPQHRYTAMLLSSIPVVSTAEERAKPSWPWDRTNLEREGEDSSGCAFAPRCPFVIDACTHEQPALANRGEMHQAACVNPSEEILAPAAS